MPTKKVKSPIHLHDLLLAKIQALYDIEHELVKALPKMLKNSKSADLGEAFETHHRETRMQINRLEKIFEILDKKPSKLRCEGIRGIIDDAEWVIKNILPFEARDANLIAAAQYAEHYEMAGYRSAVEWAKLLEFHDIKRLLEENLNEEVEASKKLEMLATDKINSRAMHDDTEESSLAM